MPEVLARWYTRTGNLSRDGALLVYAAWYCRQDTEEDTIKCCNQIVPFSNFTCHAWVLMLSSRPGTGEDRSNSQLV